MTCNCIEVVNERLAEMNTRLKEPMFLIGRLTGEQDKTRRLFIETEQIETGRGKQKAVSMFTAACPFCGEKYE
jgi:hypothetical protein